MCCINGVRRIIGIYNIIYGHSVISGNTRVRYVRRKFDGRRRLTMTGVAEMTSGLFLFSLLKGLFSSQNFLRFSVTSNL
jgi:hypothetical protein